MASSLMKKITFKSIAFMTAFVFLLESTCGAMPVLTHALATEEVSGGNERIRQFVQELSIPHELGHIEEKYIPQTIREERPVIIHVQDAHAQPDAQRKIEGILRFLTDKGQVDQVTVEGAFGDLRPELLELFPYPEVNHSIANHLLEMGELTGVELFALSNANSHVRLSGVEDGELYRKSYELFINIKEQKADVEALLEPYRKNLQKLQIQYVNEKLRELVLAENEWKEGRELSGKFFEVLKAFAKDLLQLDLGSSQNQYKWPNLTRINVMNELRKNMDQDELKRQVQDISFFLEQLHGKNPLSRNAAMRRYLIEGLDHLARGEISNFIAGSQNRGFDINNSRAWTEKLVNEIDSLGLSLFNYEQIRTALNYHIFHEELDVRELFSEIDRVMTGLKEKLIKTKKDRELLELADDFNLVERLLSLSLSRKQFNQLMDRRAISNDLGVKERLLALGSEDLPMLSELYFEQPLDFYRLTFKRDAIICENLMNLKRSAEFSQPKAVILVTGGFHNEGLRDLLRSENIPHVSVVPKISRLEDSALYEQAMMGRNSAIDHLYANPSTLMKNLLLQAEKDYQKGAIRSEQADLILRAIVEGALPALEAMGLSRAQIEVLTETALADHELFRGLSLGLRYNSEASALPWQVAQDGAQRSELFEESEPTPVTEISRSEARIEHPRAEQFIRENLTAYPYTEDELTQYVSQLNAAVREVQKLKENQLARPDEISLMDTHHHSVHRPSRDITVIEHIVHTVYGQNNVHLLPLPFRFAFALAAFDEDTVRSTYNSILSVASSINLDEYARQDRLTAVDYDHVSREYSRAEQGKTYAENLLLRYALNEVVFNITRAERAALEKESLLIEFLKETKQPGTGNIPKIVFLTDIHGAPQVGELIGKSLGLKNYQGIQTLDQLQDRLRDEGININDLNIMFIGGSDYVDRGPKPYWGFEFNRWLREHGKLKFIIGNHDMWKDWNLLGVHLRVHDSLRQILAGGKFKEADIHAHMETIGEFISELDLSQDELEALEVFKRNIIERLRNEGPGGDSEELIEELANQIIDAGANPNHSMYWWAREWYEHAGWADVFLDQLNEIIINTRIEAINEAYAENPDFRDRVRRALNTPGNDYEGLSEETRSRILLNQSILIQKIDASLFSKGEDVKRKKDRIKEIKAENAQIRAENEALTAAGRLQDRKPQKPVPNTFPETSQAAQEKLAHVLNDARILNRLGGADILPAPDSKVVTETNFNKNPIVMDTVLWDMQNFRLVYVDRFGNAYLHGILPIKDEDLAVTYEVINPETGRVEDVLTGIAALERAQFDVRTFFEKYNFRDGIPRTPEFRKEMMDRLGPAFKMLEDFYSDSLAYLKPAKIKEFLNKGGPDKFPLSYTSAMNPRIKRGGFFVGHVDLGKILKEGISYWEGESLFQSLIHGDFGMSPAYDGLGAVIEIFGRNDRGDLTGIVRRGFAVSRDFLDKKLKKLEEKLKAAGAEEAAGLQTQIAETRERLEQIIERGNIIEDIPISGDLKPEYDQTVMAYSKAPELIRLYVEAMINENISAYQSLALEARNKALYGRAGYYESKIDQMNVYWHEFVANGGVVKSEEIRRGVSSEASQLRRSYEETQEFGSSPTQKSEVRVVRKPELPQALQAFLGSRDYRTLIRVAQTVTQRFTDPYIPNQNFVSRSLYETFTLPQDFSASVPVDEAQNQAGLLLLYETQAPRADEFYYGIEGLLSKGAYKNLHVAVIVDSDDELEKEQGQALQDKFKETRPEFGNRFSIHTSKDLLKTSNKVIATVRNQAQEEGADVGLSMNDFMARVAIYGSSKEVLTQSVPFHAIPVHREVDYGMGAQIYNLDQQAALLLKLLPAERIKELGKFVAERGVIPSLMFFRGQDYSAIDEAFRDALASHRFAIAA